MYRQIISHLKKSENIKKFLLLHKDKIKTAILPVAVGISVLFFWFYGSGEEQEIKNSTDTPPMESSETEAQLTEGGEIYVDIDGEVNKPGVYKVSEGTRLFQIIELAGGLTDNAATESLNRAEAVYDGQKITVYSSVTESPSQTEPESGITGGKVNINTADSVTLQTIPGIGPSKAARIIEYRESTGRFKKIEDIKNVTGIGDMTFENIKDYITV